MKIYLSGSVRPVRGPSYRDAGMKNRLVMFVAKTDIKVLARVYELELQA